MGAARTLDDIEREATSSHRFRAVLVTAFAGLALLLALVGVFGILSYSVQQRVRDFAVRRAMGATTGDVLQLVAGAAARLVVSGVVLGLLLSSALSWVLAAVLYGVEPFDLTTFATVGVLLVVTAAMAVAAPAWRAVRVDPARALRAQ